ncbi:MAG TPA: hypothetical protein VNY52_07995 [Solirubrobacteraceae bacterium]|jgi:hypothetical protein|nr:hypothetical protein [Solirubrobacteraceae bacterium]
MAPREPKQTLLTGLALGVIACLAAAAFVIFAFAALAAIAHAGEYHVYSCRTPSGQVAPTDGWSAPEHPTYDPTLNTCQAGGGLIAALDAGYEHVSNSGNDKATWAFEAPAGETIAGATLWRAGNTPGGANENASYIFWLSGVAATGLNTQIFDECSAKKGCASEGNLTNPAAGENRVVAPSGALHSPYLALSTSCGSFVLTSCPTTGGGKIPYSAMVELFAADLVLSQTAGPTVSSVGGGLVEDPTVEGTTDVAFHAADPGSGVYEAIFQVDGQILGRRVLDEDGGRCRNVGGTSDGLPAFLYTQPCPPSLSVDLPFDTTPLTNGVHHLLVTVTDPAGNPATVLDRQITVANPSTSACGTGAPSAGQGPPEAATLSARWKGTARARLRGPYGAPHTIEGQLTTTAGGAVAAGGALEVCELSAHSGATTRLLATPRTDPAGRWSLKLPRDLSSCELLVAYRRHPGDPLPAAVRTLTLTVPAALRLRIAPRTAPSEGAIRFSGRLLGGPIPPGGKQLVLEARAPRGRWLEFHVIRTRPSGRLGFLYHFRLPGPARYQFRVLCEHEADFPFAAGASNVVGVFER